MATAVIQVDVACDLEDRAGFSGYERALVLVRLKGHVIGTVRVPVRVGVITASDVRTAIGAEPEIRDRLVHVAMIDWLLPNGSPKSPMPTWTVVVCTRDRTDQLRRCLDSLAEAGITDGEVIVVDNGPSDDSTRDLVKRYRVRYVREETPGLNRARRIGAALASGEVVVYTDDDVVVDPAWMRAIREPFSEPRVAAVTGPGMPLELETEGQELFERHSSFGRGFRQKQFDYTMMPPAAAGIVGSGANMAIRRNLVAEMGLFDAELDRGTPAITGGDTYAFYRLLAEGHRIVYTPDALVWHVHRSDVASVRGTVFGYGVGVYSFLTRCVIDHRDFQAIRVGVSWFASHHVRELGRVFLRRKERFPLRLVTAEIRGSLLGPVGHLRSRRAERSRARSMADLVMASGASS